MKLKQFLIKFINFYQKYISGFKKPSCVFYPTCSEYSKEAICRYGVIKGLKISLFRVFRCHPWQKKHLDPLK